MNWYYVDGGQQAGPVTDEQFEELRRAGKITDDTLVWREGMTDWLPSRQARPAGDQTQTPIAHATWPSAQRPGAVCAECGNMFPVEDMIRHGDAYICANCKPVFMQKLSEGVATGARRGRRSLPVNADALINEITSRGYEVDIGGCISRGWALVKSNLGISVGATFLVMLCNQAAGFLPIIGILISLLVQGPLIGGLYLFFLKMIRGESPSLGDAFSGFSKGFWRLCGTFLLMALLIYVWFIPAAVFFFAMPHSQQFGSGFWVLLAFGIVAVFYLGIAFAFALPLAADLELGPWDALRVSRRVVSMKWFSIFGLVFVAGLLSMLGLLACLIGVIFTMPILYAATLYAYEDIFGAG